MMQLPWNAPGTALDNAHFWGLDCERCDVGDGPTGVLTGAAVISWRKEKAMRQPQHALLSLLSAITAPLIVVASLLPAGAAMATIPVTHDPPR